MRTADEQAAAVEASIKRQQAERQAKYEAEIAAMRADPAHLDNPSKQPEPRPAANSAAPDKSRQETAGPRAAAKTQWPGSRATPPTATKNTFFGDVPLTKAKLEAPGIVRPTRPTESTPVAPTASPIPPTVTPPSPVMEPPATSGIQFHVPAQPRIDRADDKTRTHPAATISTTPPSSPTKAEAGSTEPTNEDGKARSPDKKKKPVLTPEQLRKRALMAAKSRGRGR